MESEKKTANIAINNVNPSENYNLYSCIEKFEELHEKYGAKFNLFIPSFYLRRFPITERKGKWIEWISSFPFFEISSLGYHYIAPHHTSKNPKENEFIYFDGLAAEDRFFKMFEMWKSVGIRPQVFAFPGGEMSPHALTIALREFNVVLKDCSKKFGPLYNWEGKAKVVDQKDNIHANTLNERFFWNIESKNLLTDDSSWNKLEERISEINPEFFFLSQI